MIMDTEAYNNNRGINGGESLSYQSLSIGLPWRVLVFAIVLFAFSILVYFGLRFGYATFLEKQSAGLDGQIGQLASEVSQQDRQAFVVFYSQLVNLKGLLASHTYSTKAFDFLEKYTLPQIYFTSAKVRPSGGNVELQGAASSVDGLVSQLAVFDAAPELSGKTVVNQMSLNGQTVEFSITLPMSSTTLSHP